MTIRKVTDADMSVEDRTQLTLALRTWRDEGVENPLIPSDVDIDGDGTVDAFGLDEDGELVYVSGVSQDDTVLTVDQTEEVL